MCKAVVVEAARLEKLRAKDGRYNEEKVYILFGRRCVDRLMWRFEGRGIISNVSEGNAEIMGGNKKEEISLAHHGDIKGTVQGRYRREVAYVAISRHHGVGNRSEELVG